jgi:hypothetical protein
MLRRRKPELAIAAAEVAPEPVPEREAA